MLWIFRQAKFTLDQAPSGCRLELYRGKEGSTLVVRLDPGSDLWAYVEIFMVPEVDDQCVLPSPEPGKTFSYLPSARWVCFGQQAYRDGLELGCERGMEGELWVNSHNTPHEVWHHFRSPEEP